MDEIERTFEELESIFVDPEYRSSLEEVDDINRLLLDGPVSEDEAYMLLAGVNSKWRKNGYHNRRLHVTGGMFIGGNHDDIEYPELEPSNLSDFVNQSVMGTDFMLRAVPRLQNGKLSVEQQVHMRGWTEIEDDEGIGGASMESCVIPLMPDTTIECRDMTPQKAAAWLDVYHQDTKLLIDQCIMQADDEAGAAINLRDTPMPLAEGNKKDVRELKRVLRTYLEANLEFEQFIPYRAVLFGAARVFDTSACEWMDNEMMSVEKTLLTIMRPLVRLNKKTNALEVWVEGNIVTSKTEVMYVKMPLKTIDSLESGRGIYRP